MTYFLIGDCPEFFPEKEKELTLRYYLTDSDLALQLILSEINNRKGSFSYRFELISLLTENHFYFVEDSLVNLLKYTKRIHIHKSVFY